MRRGQLICWSFVITFAAATLAGCAPSPYFRYPDFLSPGTAPYQRSLAIPHDPYPSTVAGPEIVGGRPLAYQQPVPEVERARMYNPPKRALQPVPALEPTVIGPPVATSPWAAPAPPPVTPNPFSTQPPPAAVPYSYPATPQQSPFLQQQRSPY